MQLRFRDLVGSGKYILVDRKTEEKWIVWVQIMEDRGDITYKGVIDFHTKKFMPNDVVFNGIYIQIYEKR